MKRSEPRKSDISSNISKNNMLGIRTNPFSVQHQTASGEAQPLATYTSLALMDRDQRQNTSFSVNHVVAEALDRKGNTLCLWFLLIEECLLIFIFPQGTFCTIAFPCQYFDECIPRLVAPTFSPHHPQPPV